MMTYPFLSFAGFWFANIFFRIFTSLFMSDISLYFSFIIMFLLDFGIKVCYPHKINWSVLSLSVSWKTLSNTDIISSLKW